MYVEEWIFIRSNGKVALTQERHAKNKEMMDESIKNNVRNNFYVYIYPNT